MANKLPKESDFPALLGTNGSGKPRPIFPSPWIPGSHHDRKPGSKKNNYDRLLSMNPYQQALDLSDVDSCVVLENECFPPSEAASREKFIYRISNVGGLCIGLFTTVSPNEESTKILTYKTAKLAEPNQDRRSVLLAHLVVTLTNNHTVQDEDMTLPVDWQSPHPAEESNLGHKKAGRTVAIHSLAVLPEFQGDHLGSTLLDGFVQMVREAKAADRIALITYQNLTAWYERLGFSCRGPSNCQYGGGGWFDMVSVF